MQQSRMNDNAFDADRSAVSFHEATVVGFSQTGASIELQLEGVTFDKGKHVATVILEDVTNLDANGAFPSRPTMEAADAEVLTLDLSDKGMKLIVEWNDWELRKQFVRSYHFQANVVRLRIVR